MWRTYFVIYNTLYHAIEIKEMKLNKKKRAPLGGASIEKKENFGKETADMNEWSKSGITYPMNSSTQPKLIIIHTSLEMFFCKLT